MNCRNLTWWKVTDNKHNCKVQEKCNQEVSDNRKLSLGQNYVSDIILSSSYVDKEMEGGIAFRLARFCFCNLIIKVKLAFITLVS